MTRLAVIAALITAALLVWLLREPDDEPLPPNWEAIGVRPSTGTSDPYLVSLLWGRTAA